MTKTIVFASICCVASYLLGSAAFVNGQADEQKPGPASPQRSFIGRYQIITSNGPNGTTRIFDTATGKFVYLSDFHDNKWIMVDPFGDPISQEEESEAAKRALNKNQDAN